MEIDFGDDGEGCQRVLFIERVAMMDTHIYSKREVYPATITSLVTTPLLHNLITITTSGQ